jgi:hypothetical protein
VIGYPQPSSLSPSNAKEPLENASHVRNAVARFKQVKGVTEPNVVRRGSESSRLQSDMEWNLKTPTSANTPRCTPAMAAGGGLFDNGVFGREIESGSGVQESGVRFFRTKF